MSKRKGVTIYEKEKGKGYYADFRSRGGKLEALIAKGERRATTDPDTAAVLVGERIKELEDIRREGRAAAGKEATLGAFALHHLKQKAIDIDEGRLTDWTLGGVQRALKRA